MVKVMSTHPMGMGEVMSTHPVGMGKVMKCVRGIPDPVRAPALQHSGGRSDGLFGLPELGLSLVGSLQGRSAIHSCNSTVGHAWRGLNSLLWLALSWGLLGLVIYTTTDPLNS